ncbi:MULTISPECIES: hypothetical protein [unclassified Streptomyces]|uniref:hypothetical protein n=1 Tax=unclassified Streptomyces TaxID=2593676 RepID=UPI0029B92833|nr:MULTISPECIES: hypothetical protein [unclassified Streptomyces]MDX3772126.1 hypothetical protein [Streptomyces sp. AK08-01B]MDX3821653.1 hypothetical protein [Streptomyces sp. AK08-01A]
MPRASARRSRTAQRHTDSTHFVLFEARPAGPTFAQLIKSSEASPHQASGPTCLHDIITEQGRPPPIWTRADSYKFRSEHSKDADLTKRQKQLQ